MKSIVYRLMMVAVFSVVLMLQACASSAADHQALALGQANFAVHNYPLAFKRLLPLAKKGHSDAQYAVGYMYYYGYGVARDEQQAFAWIEKAATQHQKKALEAMALINRATGDPFYAPPGSV